MTIIEATFVLALFNSLCVPLLMKANSWRKSVDRRLTRIEQKLNLDPITQH